MAAADIASINILAIAGLNKPLTVTDMAVSRITYNSLPYISGQQKVPENYSKHIRAAIAMIRRHGMGKNFRPHIAHRHDFVSCDKIRLEGPVNGTSFKLTKPADISNLNLGNLYPTCFRVIGTDIVGFEYAEGPAPLEASKIPVSFLEEWIAYLNRYDLANIFTLDFGDFGKEVEATSEIEVGLGDTDATLVMPLSAMNDEGFEQIPTSWIVRASRAPDPEARDSSPNKPAPGTHWAKRVNDLTHKVYINSSATEVGTDEQLVDALRKVGILKAP